MPQIKQACSVTQNSQSVVLKGVDLTARIKANTIFLVDGLLVPYTVAIDSVYSGGDTIVTLTGQYEGASDVAAPGVFATDLTYPDLIPTISQGDVGTAAIFSKAMYRLQAMLKTITPDGLQKYTDYFNAVESHFASINATAAVIATEAGQVEANTAAAAASRDAAHASEVSASANAASAAISTTNSAAHEANAAGSAGAALASKNAATASASNAATSEANALSSKNAAATSESNALASKNAASTSAANAAASETGAAASATAASSSKDAAAGSKDAAAASAANAATSAAASSTSATSAQGSATAATTSALNSATSATAADASKTAAATSATAAKDWATHTGGEVAPGQGYSAFVHANDAAASATNAASSAAVSSGQAGVATTKAGEAASSAAAAAGSASTATTQAGVATSKADDAAVSATNAAGSAAALQAALASFRSKYIGAAASDPTVDGNGDALTPGIEYFNTVSNKMRVWDTDTGWKDYDAAAQTAITNAALSASQAAASAQAALDSKNASAGSESTVVAAKNAAAASESNAAASESNAAASASSALSSKNAAKTSEDNAAASATLAAQYQAGQVNADWNATSGKSQILNKPDLVTGAGASGTWPISITGSAAAVNGIVHTQLNAGIDLNDVTTSGFYNLQSGHANAPGAYGSLMVFRGTNDTITQIYGDYASGSLSTRSANNLPNAPSWRPWRIVLDAVNFNGYSPTNGGVGATGTWGINITGNAQTVQVTTDEAYTGVEYLTLNRGGGGYGSTQYNTAGLSYVPSTGNFKVKNGFYTDLSAQYGKNLYVGNAPSAGPNQASVAVTDGNIHIDPTNSGTHGTYLNYYSGTGGVKFGDGNQNIPAAVSGGGAYTGTNFIGPGTGLTGYADGLSVGGYALGLTGVYVSGGNEKPNYFGANKLRLQMLQGAGANLPSPSPVWNDVLWLSSYSGGDVKQSNALIMGKNAEFIGFSNQNFDSGSWGPLRTIWHSGNIGFDVNASGGTAVQRTANGYIQGNYINMTDDGNPGYGGPAVTAIITKQGDNYYRSTDKARVKTFFDYSGNEIRTQRTNQATFIGHAWELAWRNYGDGHTIFDASKGLSPVGSAVNNTNAEIAWSGSYPTLMGWNGANTYGVRVDSARRADSAGNADQLSGMSVSTGAGANTIAQRDVNGSMIASGFYGGGGGLTGTASSLTAGGVVGTAAMVLDGSGNGQDNTNGDWNNRVTSGVWRGVGCTNAPGDGWWYVLVESHASNWVKQTATAFGTNGGGNTGTNTQGVIYVRTCENGTWRPWTRLVYLNIPQAWTANQQFTGNKGNGSYGRDNTDYGLQAFSTDVGAAALSLHRGGAYATNISLDPDNCIRFAGWSAGAGDRFTFNMGNSEFTAQGNIVAYSDERLKSNWRDLGSDFVARWAGVKHGIYDRIDSGERQVGLSAQAVQQILPDAVSRQADGYLALNYGAAAGVATIKLAEKSVELEQRVAELEQKLYDQSLVIDKLLARLDAASI